MPNTNISDANSVHHLVAKAESTRTHEGTLAELLHTGNVLVHRALSQNHKTPSETLHVLAKSDDELVIYSVARHVNTAIETLVELSKHAKSDIAYSATQHPTYQLYNSFFAAF